MKNKSYIGISFIILVFGILTIPKIVDRIKNEDVVKNDRLNVVQGKQSDLFTVGKAPFFRLTNQDGKTITHEFYKGKVYVVEFFFATCPSICPVMNQNMLYIQESYNAYKDFGIASITIDPANDTPQALKAHAQQLGAVSPNWNFLTGDKEYIYKLANKGFKIYAGENKQAAGGFEHSGLFALIDKYGNIRCRLQNGSPIMYYSGLNYADEYGMEEDLDGKYRPGVEALKEDIKKLLEE